MKKTISLLMKIILSRVHQIYLKEGLTNTVIQSENKLTMSLITPTKRLMRIKVMEQPKRFPLEAVIDVAVAVAADLLVRGIFANVAIPGTTIVFGLKF